ncbi:hypothetical protein KCP78_15705 [Salmonella enterica subsp. enterica]|nr:hypothetical protein KCP78_15705 [Salmonella enterica subsp. enterica]
MFSRTGLDIGARFFMQHLPERHLDGEITSRLRQWGDWPEAYWRKIRRRNVVFVDESPMAVDFQPFECRNEPAGSIRTLRIYMIGNALSGVGAVPF